MNNWGIAAILYARAPVNSDVGPDDQNETYS